MVYIHEVGLKMKLTCCCCCILWSFCIFLISSTHLVKNQTPVLSTICQQHTEIPPFGMSTSVTLALFIYLFFVHVTVKLPVRSFKADKETTNSVFLYWPPAVDQHPDGRLLIIEDVEGYHLQVRSYSDYRGVGDLIQDVFAPQSACPGLWLLGLYPGHKYHVSVFAVDDEDNIITSPASIVVETCKYHYTCR